MLPSTLLRIKRRGNKILPNFAALNYENEFASATLIDTYQEHVGKDVESLENSLEEVESELEDMGYHPKFVRGLIELLDRLIEVEGPKTKVPPDLVRRMVFAISSEKGFALTESLRLEILREAAKRLDTSLKEVVEAFNASYEGSEVITGFKAISPMDLLRQYNLSLLQTLMFKATYMRLTANMTGSEAKSLLRAVKRLGLMYTAEKEDEVTRLHIDGPASTLTLTRRYGVRMAKIIPLILRLRRWRIQAEIYHMKRRFLMELDERLRELMPLKPPIEEDYDSLIEEEFALKFRASSFGWEIMREPEPLIVDGSIFVPDFALVRNDTKVYLEIVGFWTRQYIEKKIKKLAGVDEPMIVAISRRLACTRDIETLLSSLPRDRVVIFDDKLRLSDIIPVLRDFDVKSGGAKLRRIEEAYRQLDREAIASYLLGIKEEPLQSVINTLRTLGVRDLEDAYRIIKEHGLTIVWRGLDPSKAIVKRS
ncbi:MAG: DUF790 family protein [Candidatus Nezhaarchaeota archaeon]|nr:DUF790 family protein [Candidatus Nezhaarchaeota archaeon]MCX8142356.1 DUF790 family protein [Candidatus Nezhaarchaeota archaeon]MDW8050671.1 DUF790 family protein [Nitrososphaerota archaeon]